MKTLVILLISGIFTNNIITFGLLGVNELEENKTKNLLSVLKHCAFITAQFVLGTIITYPVLKFVLMPLKLEFLSALVTTVLLCGLMFVAYTVCAKLAPKLNAAIFYDAKTLLCSVSALGLCLMNLTNDLVTSYPFAILYSLIAGFGFTLVSLAFYAINERINSSDLPRSVKGLPITLIIVALMSLAFGGFAGI